ncbi:hypothetical protein [Clostridium cibarium]|uniref:Spo0E like sporulation regulatory protein n=1 Tax=Clostridium cibarium TaxID=2762247 RepID=A0ABR8PY29_9CLOT|nr:hypothetical protein [Clostridium cibarium]MBD7913076.1 hypothetical protein [Clostridium cibarium]
MENNIILLLKDRISKIKEVGNKLLSEQDVQNIIYSVLKAKAILVHIKHLS